MTPVVTRAPFNVVVPTTESAVAGVEVPIPTFPLCFTSKLATPEDEATLIGSNAAAVPWIFKFTVDEFALIPATKPLSIIIPLPNADVEVQIVFHLLYTRKFKLICLMEAYEIVDNLM
jgi:hypothetical protein